MEGICYHNSHRIYSDSTKRSELVQCFESHGTAIIAVITDYSLIIPDPLTKIEEVLAKLESP